MIPAHQYDYYHRSRQPRRHNEKRYTHTHHQEPYDGMGYRNIFTGQRVPPCKPCRDQASFLLQFHDNNPLLPDCTCRIVPPTPAHTTPILMPNTIYGATHAHIGKKECIAWDAATWHQLVFEPIARCKIWHSYGLIIRFIVFLPHTMALGVPHPQNITRILEDMNIGTTYQDVLTFVFRDLRNAFCDTNFTPTTEIEEIINDKTRRRTRNALAASCLLNLPYPT